MFFSVVFSIPIAPIRNDGIEFFSTWEQHEIKLRKGGDSSEGISAKFRKIEKSQNGGVQQCRSISVSRQKICSMLSKNVMFEIFNFTL